MTKRGISKGEIEAREAVFQEEAVAMRLKFRCADCAHFLPSSGRCSMGYPNRYLLGPLRGIQEDGHATFCKYWELSESSEEGEGQG